MEFEKKRNRPLKYDRELMGTTIKAMKRIAEIKANREARHIEQRFRGKKKLETLQAIKELRQFKDIIKPPTATKPSLISIRAAARLQKMQSNSAGGENKSSLLEHQPQPVEQAS